MRWPTLLTLIFLHEATVAHAAITTLPQAGSWLRNLWSAQGFLDGLVDGMTTDADRTDGVWPANVSFGQIIDELVPKSSLDRFVVNLGANDGARHDPAFPLLVERGYGGILVEGDPSFRKRLYQNVRPYNESGRLKISWGFASAWTIGARLLAAGCPLNPDALKIDVDGLDAALLEGILNAGISPKAIVVEVNPDIPPPVRISQLFHEKFTFEFQRKHMRGWLGASADALYSMLTRAGYALVAIELGTKEHLVCTGAKGKKHMCKRRGTCTHCENNMWFVQANLLRATAGVEPPTWPQFVNAFWKQTFAFNTYELNKQVFTGQQFSHQGAFTRTDEDRPFTPECYSLSEHQFYPAQRGESFTKPACPLQTLRAQADGEGGTNGHSRIAQQNSGWRSWAKVSTWLAKPANAAKAAAYAKSTAEAIKAPACRPDETCPYNASATVHATRSRGLSKGHGQSEQDGSTGRRLGIRAEQVHPALEGADYRAWVKTPQQVADSPGAFLLNPMAANHGHVKMAQDFTKVLGFKSVDQVGIQGAQKLQSAGTPFAYLTLTNDHQPLTEHGHDLTLAWERSAASQSANGVFIGPPGEHVYEGPRKAVFCELSEDLVKRTGDPWQRFTPPCVTKDKNPTASQDGSEYAALLRSAPPVVKAPELAHLGAPPRWLTRKVATKRVAAAGGFMYPLSHEKALASNMTSMHKWGPLLLRYLDPPLLQKAVHLGTPVQARVEVRVFGLVQWEPLRVWTSRYGFFRGGTPWINYSASVDFNAANGPMWNVNRGVEAKCETTPPSKPPPWRDAASYNKCRAKATKKECCVCLTVADIIDLEDDERGFSTSGTLRRLDHVAAANGLNPRRVWQSVDEALIRNFVQEQRMYQAKAKGAPLSRWATLFSADVGFSADGRAYLYENLLMPNWKRPGYFWHEAVDRAGGIGIYSGQMLAMAPLLVDTAADRFHEGVVKPLSLAPEKEKEVLGFLRTQGFASALGFRRTWPTPARAPAHNLDAIADPRDVSFARLLNEHKLLLSRMDVLSAGGNTDDDLWGGPSADPAKRGSPRWPVGKGTLWDAPSGYGRGNVCDDTPRILEEYKRQRRQRMESLGKK